MVDAACGNMVERGGPTLARLIARSWEFDFFQAVWLLQRYVGSDADVGGRGPLADEAIRFRPGVSVSFSPADVGRLVAYESHDGRTRFRMESAFMGLYGVSTPLPLHYAIDLLRSVAPYVSSDAEAADLPAIARLGDDGLPAELDDTNPVRDFYDIFHHRLISLFYRCWMKYRYDLAFGVPGRDAITEHLLRLIGLSTTFDYRTLGVPPVRMIRYAGALTQHPRSSATLEGIIEDYLGGVRTRVIQFRDRWVPVAEADQNRLGERNSHLGENLTVGDLVYDLSGAFNVAVGPADWSTYLRFLPGMPAHKELRSLVRLYCADPLWFTVEVGLQPCEIPELRLTSGDGAALLGMTSWVRTREVGATSVKFDQVSARLAPHDGYAASPGTRETSHVPAGV